MAEKIKTVRLRNVNSGAVVEVPEEKADRLGTEWEPASAPKSTSAKKSAAPVDK